MPLDPDTISSYEKVTREFLDIAKKSNPAQITKQDLKDWMVKQRERVSHRTVCNLYTSIACFLHFCGVDHKKLLPQSERPSPVEETPEAYTEEEMTKFFFVITKEPDALAFEYKRSQTHSPSRLVCPQTTRMPCRWDKIASLLTGRGNG